MTYTHDTALAAPTGSPRDIAAHYQAHQHPPVAADLPTAIEAATHLDFHDLVELTSFWDDTGRGSLTSALAGLWATNSPVLFITHWDTDGAHHWIATGHNRTLTSVTAAIAGLQLNPLPAGGPERARAANLLSPAPHQIAVVGIPTRRPSPPARSDLGARRNCLQGVVGIDG